MYAAAAELLWLRLTVNLFKRCSSYFNVTASEHYTTSNVRRIWKNIEGSSLCWNLMWLRKSTIRLSVYAVSEPRYEPRTSRIRSRDVKHSVAMFCWTLTTLSCSDSTRLVTGLSSLRSGFAPRSVCVWFAVDKVAQWQAFLWVLRFSPVSTIPPLLLTCRRPLRCAIALTKQHHAFGPM
jgi:hypothetical protein